MKDVSVALGGDAGILGSQIASGDHRRGWNFRSAGRGGVDFKQIIHALCAARCQGPLFVEWEGSAMERVQGATEPCAFSKKLDFAPSTVAFDAHFDKQEERDRLPAEAMHSATG
jgi:sugar phosphate isomerase/epimerase